MKRVIASVTSFCLAFSMFMMPAMAYASTSGLIHPAAAFESGGHESTGIDTSNLLPLNQAALELSAMSIDASDYEGPAPSGGIVDITVESNISSEQGLDLKAKLYSNDSSKSYDASFSRRTDAEGNDSDGYFCRLDNVASGNYFLTVGGGYYATFSQDITIEDGNRMVVSLVDSASNSIYTDENGFGMGLVPYGDFDKNGSVNSDDASKLAEAMAQYASGSSLDSVYDLDEGNGLDASDVQLFAMNIDSQSEAKIRTTKDVTQMEADSSSVDFQKGDIESLFIDNGVISQLTPKPDESGQVSDISQSNPVEFSVTPKTNTVMEGVTIAVPPESEGTPTQGSVEVVFEDGTTAVIQFSKPEITSRNMLRSYMALAATPAMMALDDSLSSGTFEYDEKNGIIKIDFGKQVPVKMVTIRVTATSSNKLAEIAQVEFLNGMEDAIPAPELNIPGNISAVAGDKKFDITWRAETNVTGYQVEVSAEGAKQVFPVNITSLSVSSLNSKKIKNGIDYSIRIRSVNDGWYSPWSNPVIVRPLATKVPAVPEGISLVPGFNDIAVSWKEAEDADTYNVFWRPEDSSEWHEVNGIASTSYNLTGLVAGKSYYIQLSATNNIGTSAKSAAQFTTTKTAEIKVPWYNLINRAAQSNTTGQTFDDPISSVTYSYDNDSANNPDFEERSVVDGDYGTYYLSPRSGSYPDAPRVYFNDPHKISSAAFTTYLGTGYASGIQMDTLKITLWDSAGQRTVYNGGNGLSATTLAGATNTYMLKFPATDDVVSAQIDFQRFVWPNWMPITFSELAFYEHADFVDEINSIWADDMHTVLADWVDINTINKLRAQLNVADPKTVTASNPEGEKHPDYERLSRELDNAEIVLNHGNLRDSVIIDSSIDKSINNYAGGTNAWQPLGISVKKGDKINIYVGDASGTASNTNTALRLYVCQQHPVSSRPVAELKSSLKIGLNEIDVTGGYTTEACEDGGALYVEYISTNKNLTYSVRVEGGTEIPRLELHGITDQAERQALCLEYVNKLEDHVKGLEAYHNENHNDVNDGAYDAHKCTANMTDIGIDYMLYSIPASQAWNALSGSTNEEKAVNLEKALSAGDANMLLFYQFKGLSDLSVKSGDTTNYGNRGLPKSRQNVRYTQMFAGAFMYAAGNHIGVQWAESGNTISIPGVEADENGKWISGRYWGWGLNHEIGHEINQGAYAIAETTNNIYPQLSQSHDSTDTTRWGDYTKVYNQVTSGAEGFVSGGTGIAMYWQLHLAYDGQAYMDETGKPSYNYKMYDNYTDLFNNLIFARIDNYARNPSLAPAPKGVALDLSRDCDTHQALIRLACAAAQKDLREYFKAWGHTSNATTDAYASQFPVEERGIQYITDEVRTYQFDNYSSKTSAAPAAPTGVSASYEYGSNTVDVDLSSCPTGNNILGYEILRDNTPVGFVTAGTKSFTDTINTVNNRVFTYDVKVVDKWLNRSEPVQAGVFKIHHDNILDKSKWTVSTDLREGSNDGVIDESKVEDYDWSSTSTTSNGSTVTSCSPVPEVSTLNSNKAIDGDRNTVFEGTSDASNAQLTIDFGEQLELTAVRYIVGNNAQNPISQFRIELSEDGENWTQVDSGTFDVRNGIATVYLDDGGSDRLFIFDAGYLRLTAVGQSSVSIAEIDVLGPTGDDVELLENGIGILNEDTGVGTDSDGNEVVIPKDSLVFTGTYQGNPAYNVVMLYDNDKLIPGSERPQNDAVINGHQIIFGLEPVDGELPDVKNGYWVYYITADEMAEEGWTLPKNVSAELYRVDDALTLEGQRRVANTTGVAVPDSEALKNNKIVFAFDITEYSSAQSDDTLQFNALSNDMLFGDQSQNAENDSDREDYSDEGQNSNAVRPDDIESGFIKDDEDDTDE